MTDTDCWGVVERAALFAAEAHATQRRKWTDEPYFVHPEAVAERVRAAGGSDVAIAAAYLHDTIEDTAVTYEQVVQEFGEEIADVVVEVTNVYTHEAYPHLNRMARVRLEAQRLAGISATAKLVKRMDIADNVEDVEALDPGFARIYLPEKQVELDAIS